MTKGSKKGLHLSSDDILKATNGGYDILKYHLGNLSRQMSRPWGKKEKKMSWGVYPKDSIWWWKDAATEESGTAIQFIQKKFGLTFREAVDKIAWDFGLGGTEINVAPVKVTWEKPEIDNKEYSHIAFESQPFKKKHHEFWNCVDVSESWCNKFECWAVKSAALNRKIIPIGKDEIVFAYYCPEEDGVKLYFPERDKDKKFLTNISYHHLWNFSNLTECEDLVVTKSNKDMIVTALLAPCITSTMAEAVRIFVDKDGIPTEVVSKINSITKRPWIWYGSDFDGVSKCKEITDTNKWRYINTPKNLLPEINDQYLYVKTLGLKALEDFMKHKKLLRDEKSSSKN